ncbi:ABC transporter substrate-binding protein [uncultured Shewanella sp.]|uniref:substrate-binding periplasmic protein n=1 Tax=Shewanella atlantica TaxID=271099 RepID=UPI0026291D81|nr:transporter substrate-binding domain-containing protein [uncultured Shewanella sp.]
MTIQAPLFLATLTLTLFLISLASSADERQPRSVVSPLIAVENSWPPYADEMGEGLSTSIVKHAFSAVGITPKIQVLPYARVLYDIKNGNIAGGFNVSKQAATEAIYLFGSSPLFIAKSSFFFRPGEGAQFTGIDDLPDDFKIGQIFGYEYGQTFEHEQHRFRGMKVSSQTQLINILLAGRVDAVIMYDEVAKYTLDKMKLDTTSLYKGFPNQESRIHLAFSLKHPDSETLAEALDKGIEIIRANGVYDKIVAGELD